MQSILQPSKKKLNKNKLQEFTMPVLGLDRRKRRHEMQNADQETRIEQVVEFAGVEYKYYFVSTTSHQCL